ANQPMGPLQDLKYAVLRQMILAMARAGQADKAMKLVETLEGPNKDDLAGVALRARVEYELGRYEDAVKTYDKLIARIATSDRWTRDEKGDLTRAYRYELSSVYIDLNKIDKAAEILQGLLKDKPDNPTYNNDLGYIWADHGMNLEESERLIRKALVE